MEDSAKKKLHEELDTWIANLESTLGEHKFTVIYKLDHAEFNIGTLKVVTEEVAPVYSYTLVQK